MLPITIVNKKGTKDQLFKFFSSISIFINGFGHPQKGNSCEYRINIDFEIIYIMKGEKIIEVNNIKYRARKGDLFIIPPLSINKIVEIKDLECEYYWIHFDMKPLCLKNNLCQLLFKNTDEYKISISSANDIQEIEDSFLRIENEKNSAQPGYKIIEHSYLLNILMIVIRQNKNSIQLPEISGNNEYEHLIEATQYIENNISKKIRVKDIADYVHVSESYIYKIFKDSVKLTPNQYSQIIKMKNALLLIQTSSLSFKEIADYLGFTDYNYFSRIFKKWFKECPATFKLHVNDNL